MATLDSVIAVLGTMPEFKFNELDAFIIASKRKIGVLSSTGRYVETLPLARRIIERLEDYEAHPDQYADDSKRVPADSACRASYINFYRTQAQGYISAAYTALGQYSSMTEAYLQIERSVTAATAREHIARYNALEQRMQRQEAEARAEREQARADNIRLQAIGILVIALLAIGFAVILFRKNRDIRQKNRVLAQQLVEFYDNTRPNEKEEVKVNSEELDSMSPEDLYQHIRAEVIRLQLYTDPGFGRQSIIERFHLTKDVASRVFSQGSEHGSISSFITDCRLDHARRLLVSRPDMSIGDIAAASGFGVRTTFTRSFKAKYGLTPTEFREQ
ncbi:MAG: AraC family transcriptional regulator [Bacteroidaceae bacterium]|nr:AraC family transcriptional regulator [Bacteroidaceae bacterium]